MAGDGTQNNAVNGYLFEDEQAAIQARKELEGIRYIQSKTDKNKPEMVLQMYRHIINEKLFETPVGYGYLKELQEYLITFPGMRNEDIPPIPIVRQKPLNQKEAKKETTEEKQAEKSEQPEKKIEVIERNVNYKARYKGAMTVAVTLLIIVAAMFAITLTSNSPNILNYENKLQNKYAGWESQLNEREKTIRAREDALRQQAEPSTEETAE